MDNFIAARSQMAMSLAFHIIFATIGVSLPLMMTSDLLIAVAAGAVVLIPSLGVLFRVFKAHRKAVSATAGTLV